MITVGLETLASDKPVEGDQQYVKAGIVPNCNCTPGQRTVSFVVMTVSETKDNVIDLVTEAAQPSVFLSDTL